LEQIVRRYDDVPIVVGGDITDLGREAEWELFRQTVGEVETRIGRSIRRRLRLIPGNHDLSINVGAAPDVEFPQARKPRELSFRKAVTWCESPATSTLTQAADIETPRELTLGSARLFLLNSCLYPSRFVLSNAVGMFGHNQLDKLRNILSSASGAVIVVAHHHVSRLEREAKSWLEWATEIFLIATDSRALMRILAEYAKRAPQNHCLIIHGHRHQELHRKTLHLHIYGHPSSTMGDVSGGALDGQLRFASVYLGPTGNYAIHSENVPYVVSEPGL
jgi:hypothetical protein